MLPSVPASLRDWWTVYSGNLRLSGSSAGAKQSKIFVIARVTPHVGRLWTRELQLGFYLAISRSSGVKDGQ